MHPATLSGANLVDDDEARMEVSELHERTQVLAEVRDRERARRVAQDEPLRSARITCSWSVRWSDSSARKISS
jgi:hypothetical protein